MKRFEYIGKTKVTLEDVDVQVLKKGQTDTVPALLLTLVAKMPNTVLDKFDPTGRLRAFWYEKDGNPNNKPQQPGLDGVNAVSDLPQLTQNAMKLGNQFDYEFEQTGSALIIYRGTERVESNIKLKDGTVGKLRVTCLEGGTVHVRNTFYAGDLDSETIGDIAVLKKQELEIEMLAPELVSEKQTSLTEEEDPLTPIGGLAAAIGRNDARKGAAKH